MVFVLILIFWERTSLATVNSVWSNITPEIIGRRDATRAVETVRRHAIEMSAFNGEEIEYFQTLDTGE